MPLNQEQQKNLQATVDKWLDKNDAEYAAGPLAELKETLTAQAAATIRKKAISDEERTKELAQANTAIDTYLRNSVLKGAENGGDYKRADANLANKQAPDGPNWTENVASMGISFFARMAGVAGDIWEFIKQIPGVGSAVIKPLSDWISDATTSQEEKDKIALKTSAAGAAYNFEATKVGGVDVGANAALLIKTERAIYLELKDKNLDKAPERKAAVVTAPKTEATQPLALSGEQIFGKQGDQQDGPYQKMKVKLTGEEKDGKFVATGMELEGEGMFNVKKTLTQPIALTKNEKGELVLDDATRTALKTEVNTGITDYIRTQWDQYKDKPEVRKVVELGQIALQALLPGQKKVSTEQTPPKQ